MRKGTVAILIVAIFSAATLYAQSPTELLQQVGEDILGGYVSPLVSSFGAALNTGLFHTATAHKTGGFDFQIKMMYIPIPANAKTFTCSVPGLYFNTTTQQIDTIWFVKTTSTVFGPDSQTIVYQGRDTVAIPPVLPKGVNLSFVPFAMPQISIGIYQGSEILIRFIPTFKIPVIDEKVSFWGVGIKQEITELPFEFLDTLPLNIALQGVYQKLKIGDVVNSSALNFNIHASKTFSVITPYIGLGWENAKLRFKYDFTYEKPNTNPPPPTIQDTIIIDKTIPSDNKFRLVAGFNLKLGPVLFNAAYNLSKYSVISGGLGISIK